MKVRVLTSAAASGVVAAVDALGRGDRKRAESVGASIGATVPAAWDGVGAVPSGWVVPYGVLTEPGGARVAIVGTDAFAAGKGQFAGALDALPADWKAGDETSLVVSGNAAVRGVRD